MRMFRDTNIWTVETAAPGAPSLPMRTAVNSTRSDHLPALSPDGSRVAFFSSRSGEFELWVADRDGANAMQLTALKSLPGFPRWSPDGRTLAFHSDPEGHPDVMAVAVAGGRPRIVTAGPLSGGYPSFARDGRSIYFSGPDPQGQLRIWKMPAAGGTPTQVTDTPGDVPVESYDGRTLFYVENAPRPSALWRLPLAGGPPTKLVDGVVNGAFDVAETGVYFIDQISTTLPVAPFDNRAIDTRLRFYEFATDRAMTVVDNLGPLALGLSTSRDGRTILIARTDAAADELMVVENFR